MLNNGFTRLGLYLQVLLYHSPPSLARFMAYDTPAAYIFAAVSFCAALLSVTFGAVVLVMMTKLQVGLFVQVAYGLTSCRISNLHAAVPGGTSSTYISSVCILACVSATFSCQCW